MGWGLRRARKGPREGRDGPPGGEAGPVPRRSSDAELEPASAAAARPETTPPPRPPEPRLGPDPEPDRAEGELSEAGGEPVEHERASGLQGEGGGGDQVPGPLGPLASVSSGQVEGTGESRSVEHLTIPKPKETLPFQEPRRAEDSLSKFSRNSSPKDAPSVSVRAEPEGMTFTGFRTPLLQTQEALTPGGGWEARLQGNVAVAEAARYWADDGEFLARDVPHLSPYQLSSAGTSSMSASLRRSHKKIVQNSIRGELHNLMRGMELVVLSASFDGWRRMLQHSKAMLEVACNAWVTLFHKHIRSSFLFWFSTSQEAIVGRRKILACLARMRLRLVSRSWTSWWSHCQRQKLAALLLNRLRVTFRLRRLKNSLGHWRLVSINASIERRLLARPLRRIIRRRLYESFCTWWGWMEEQRRQRNVCARVVARWERGAVWRSLEHWAALTMDKKQERVAVGRCRRRLRLGALRRGIAAWEWWLEEQRYVGAMLRSWRDVVHSSKTQREEQSLRAGRMAFSSRLGGSFNHWRELALELGTHKRLVNRVLKRWNARAVASAMESWKGFVHTRRVTRRVVQRVTQKSLHAAWDAWVERVEEQRRQRNVCARVVARWERGAVWRSLEHWAALTMDKKQERVAVGRCRRRLRLGALRRGIAAWEWWLEEQRYVGAMLRSWRDVVHSSKTQREEQSLRAGRMAFSGRLGSSFECWYAYAEKSSARRRLARRALSRVTQKRLWLYWSAWDDAVLFSLRRRRILKKVIFRLERAVILKGFGLWAAVTLEEKMTKVAVSRGRSRVRLGIQRRVFEGWDSWLKEKDYIGTVFWNWAETTSKALKMRQEQGLRAWKMALLGRLGGCFLPWRDRASELAIKKRLLQRATSRIMHRRAWQTFSSWRNTALFTSRREKICLRVVAKVRSQTLSSAWFAWVERVEHQQKQFKLCAAAMARWELGAVWKCLRHWSALTRQEKKMRVTVGRFRRRLRLGTLRRTLNVWYVVKRNTVRGKEIVRKFRHRFDSILRLRVLVTWQAHLHAQRIARRAVNMASKRHLCKGWWSWLGTLHYLKREKRMVTRVVGRWKRGMMWKGFISWVLRLEMDRQAEAMAMKFFDKIWNESILTEERRMKIAKIFFVTQERSAYWFELAFLRQWVRATENVQRFRGIFASWWIFARREAYHEEMLNRKVVLWRSEKVLDRWLLWLHNLKVEKACLRRAGHKWRLYRLYASWRSWRQCIAARISRVEKISKLFRILSLKSSRCRLRISLHRWYTHVRCKKADLLQLRHVSRVLWDSRQRHGLRAWAMLCVRRRALKMRMKNMIGGLSVQRAKLSFRKWRTYCIHANWESQRILSRAFSSWLRVLWSANKDKNMKLRFSLFSQSNQEKVAAVTSIMKNIKFSLIEMISDLRADLRKSSREIQRLTVAEYSKQWQVAIAKEKHEVKQFLASKLEENASILMCDVLEQAETCMKLIESQASLELKQFSFLDSRDLPRAAGFEEVILETPSTVILEGGTSQISLRSHRAVAAESDLAVLQNEMLVRRCFDRWRSKPSKDIFLLAFLEIRRARTSFQQVSRSQLRELQSMPKPPKLVRLALEALCTMLNGWSHTNWEGIRRVLQSEKFSMTVLRYNGKNLTEELIEFLEENYLLLPEFSAANVAKASRACAPLVNLIVSHVSFKKLSLRFKPGRNGEEINA